MRDDWHVGIGGERFHLALNNRNDPANSCSGISPAAITDRKTGLTQSGRLRAATLLLD